MRLPQRFYDVLLSVYLFNEQRGYTYLDELALAFARKYPNEPHMLASIRKHAGDERHHHSLFRDYFERHGRAPYRVSPWCGYCDQMVGLVFGRTMEELDPAELVESDEAFFQLCRLIMITEMRGMKQVNVVLRSPFVREIPELVSIFSVVKRDEPSHCFPYQAWLRRHGKHEPSLRERLADCATHYSLMLLKLPLLFLNPFLTRAHP